MMGIEFRWLSDNQPLGEGSIPMGTVGFPIFTKLQYRMLKTNMTKQKIEWSEWKNIPVVWEPKARRK